MRKYQIILGIILLCCMVNCSKNNNRITAAASSVANGQPLPTTAVSPAGNLGSARIQALGRSLFWDPILSGNKDIACASCHHPSMGYADNLDLAIGTNGIGLGTGRHFNAPNDIPFSRRNTPSLINVGFNGMNSSGVYDPATAAMFFDNRVKGLELQCLQPMQTTEEMMGRRLTGANVMDTILSRLKIIPGYQQLFADAFGPDKIVATSVSQAIASFERSLLASNTAYDQYMRGDKTAMSAAQLSGMQAFINNGCANCHNGPMLSDFQLHVLSVPDNPKRSSDSGAGGTYAFRTPSLRNLDLTAPYMHNGMFRSLEAVLDFYDRIGDGQSQNSHVADNKLDGNLRRMNKNDANSILQFLQALTDHNFDKTTPLSVPSGLKPGGNL